MVFSFTSLDEIQCFGVLCQFSDNPPMSFSMVLLINRELSWKLFVENHEITTSNSVLSCFPSRLTSKVLLKLLDVVQSANVCLGNFDDQFIKLFQMKKGFFYSTNNQLVAILEETFCFTVNKEDLLLSYWKSKLHAQHVQIIVTLSKHWYQKYQRCQLKVHPLVVLMWIHGLWRHHRGKLT